MSTPINETYAYRARKGAPLERVTIVGDGTNKVRRQLRFDDGRIEDQPHQRLVCPWDDREALLERERRLQAFEDHTTDMRDETLAMAVNEVASAITAIYPPGPDDSAYVARDSGGMDIGEGYLRTLCDATSVSIDAATEHAFVDEGEWGRSYTVPLDTAALMAQELAAKHSLVVARALDARRRHLIDSAMTPPYARPTRSAAIEFVDRVYGPSFDLARSWAGVKSPAVQAEQQLGEAMRHIEEVRDNYADGQLGSDEVNVLQLLGEAKDAVERARDALAAAAAQGEGA